MAIIKRYELALNDINTAYKTAATEVATLLPGREVNVRQGVPNDLGDAVRPYRFNQIGLVVSDTVFSTLYTYQVEIATVQVFYGLKSRDSTPTVTNVRVTVGGTRARQWHMEDPYDNSTFPAEIFFDIADLLSIKERSTVTIEGIPQAVTANLEPFFWVGEERGRTVNKARP